jgi:hypothetical protein
MATIVDYIEDICAQTAVYWGNPQNNGAGVMTYDDPYEIDCFWIDKQVTLVDEDGKEWITEATVFVLEDLDEQGVLYLGELEDLSSDEKSNPKANLQKAREIKHLIKTPSLYDENTYVRKVIL